MMEIHKSFSLEKYEVHLLVEEQDDGDRLDQFMMKFLHSFSRQQIKKKISLGEIIIRERPSPHKASARVHYGEVVELITRRGNIEDEYWCGKKIIIETTPDIIFEDSDLIIISKPPFMTTHPSGKHLFNCATVFVEQKIGSTAHSIHRIDRETSGVLMLGKTIKGAQYYTQAFENNQIRKCYLSVSKTQKRISSFIASERLGQQEDFIPRLFTHCYPEDSEHGKPASTKFIPIYQDQEYLICLAFPKTGRQHQIRAHAAFHGFPLVGDKIYNGDRFVFTRFKDGESTPEDMQLLSIYRHMLHAYALNIPYEQSRKTLTTKIPKDFVEWFKSNIPKLNAQELETKLNSVVEQVFKV